MPVDEPLLVAFFPLFPFVTDKGFLSEERHSALIRHMLVRLGQETWRVSVEISILGRQYRSSQWIDYSSSSSHIPFFDVSTCARACSRLA